MLFLVVGLVFIVHLSGVLYTCEQFYRLCCSKLIRCLKHQTKNDKQQTRNEKPNYISKSYVVLLVLNLFASNTEKAFSKVVLYC